MLLFYSLSLALFSLCPFWCSVSAKRYIVQNNFPPRLQWEANHGYCGEVSLLSFGLANGQYLSQYDSRVAVCGTGKRVQSECQMLLSDNDQTGANNMHFVNEEWDPYGNGTPQQFLSWAKQRIAAGYLVITGLFMNYCQFDEYCDEDHGDPDFDHIVNLIGFTSSHPISDRNFYPDDELIIDDHGLYYEDKYNIPYIFKIKFSDLINDRVGANNVNSPTYSLPDSICYGITLKGLKADGAYPIRLMTSVNFEKPVMKEGANQRPPPMPMTLRLTISGLTAGTSYTLLTYNDLRQVPESDFMSPTQITKAMARTDFIATSDVQVIDKVPIRSDQTVIYRCVKTVN